MFERKRHDVPGLNTASLADLIFVILFFFMIITHMRQNEKLVHVETPAGTALEKVTHKSAVANLYVGSKEQGAGSNDNEEYVIQLNDEIIDISQLSTLIMRQRDQMVEDNRERFTVNLRIDKEVPMSLVHQIKQELRRADALKIRYMGDSSKR